MSYADIVLQRRKELENAFRERYNPAEDVLSTLADIDKEMFRRKGIEAEQERAAATEKRRAEMFGLEKSREEALAKKYEAEAAQTREDRAALARERDARAAAAREEARRKAEAASLEGGARDIYGRLLAKGQTLKNVLSASGRDEAEKAYAKKMAGALAGGTTADVAKLDAELADAQKRLEEKPPSGYTVSDIEEMAEAYGTSYGAMLAEVQRMEAEDEESRLKMGLTTEQTARQKTLQRADEELARLRARQGYPKPEREKTPEQLAAASEELAYKKLRNERIRRGLSKEGGFVPTEGEVSKMQTARRDIVRAMASANTLRQLIDKYPDFKSYVGPVDGLINRFKARFGANSKEAAEIQSAINRVFQSYKVATTGAAAGVLEMQDLKNIMPKETDNFEAIIGKLNAADVMAETDVGVIDLVLDKMDIRGADVLAKGRKQEPSTESADPYAQYSE